jgi:outer membrane lipoprotein carrier protein
MRLSLLTLLGGWVIIFWAGVAFTQNSDLAPDVEAILDGLQKRYGNAGFSARFDQTSTLKAMDISDSAEGTISVKPPDKMHWLYTAPDRQTIISDGEQLWIYRPDDNQVMVGKAPAFFSNGRGAGFLSDIGSLAGHFSIARANEAMAGDQYVLKLVPLKNQTEVSEIYLTIDKARYEIVEIVTYNAYGDETVITFSDVRFDVTLDKALFKFQIPDGADVVQLDQ